MHIIPDKQWGGKKKTLADSFWCQQFHYQTASLKRSPAGSAFVYENISLPLLKHQPKQKYHNNYLTEKGSENEPPGHEERMSSDV